MAQKIITELVDDIDGSVIDKSGETIVFGLNGTEYEIDLSAEHADELRKAIEFYIGYARKLPSRSARRAGVARTAKRSAEQSRAIRQWAREQGLDVSDRGRISVEVEQAYLTARS